MGFVTLDDAQAARLNQERGREPLSFSDYEAKRYFCLPRPRGGMYRDAFDSLGRSAGQRSEGVSAPAGKGSDELLGSDETSGARPKKWGFAAFFGLAKPAVFF